MFNRNELTLSMFYASSTDNDGNKVAAILMQVNGPESVPVQTSQLICVTDKARKKTCSVGEQMTKSGSDPLLVAIENYWRQNTEAVVADLLTDVADFIAGGVNNNATWIGFNGLKVFDNEPLENRIPEAVLQADGGIAPEEE